MPSRTIQIRIPVVEKRWWYSGVGILLLLGLFFAIPMTRHWVFGLLTLVLPLLVNGLPPLPAKFAVLPFRVVGDQSSLGYVGEGLVEALSAKFSN